MLSFVIENETDMENRKYNKLFSESEAIKVSEEKNMIVAFYD